MGKIRQFAGILHLENFSALAWGAGLGAAIGCRFFPFWMVLLLLPGIILLKKIPRMHFILAFVLALFSGISYSNRQERINNLFSRPGLVQGTVIIRDHRATRWRDSGSTPGYGENCKLLEKAKLCRYC